MTLPGVALTFVAAVGDITRFRDGDHAASYLGLTPIVRQSAGKNHRGPITKAGSSTTRAMLTQATQHAAEHPGPWAPSSDGKRKNRNVAIVATARKLVTIAYLMLKNNELYGYAQPDQVQAKLRHVERAAEGSAKAIAKAPPSEPKVEPANRLNRTLLESGAAGREGAGRVAPR